MKTNHQRLLQFLSEQKSPVPSAAIAKAIGVSVRSVKSYIVEINGTAATKRILSGKNGYSLVPGGDVADERTPTIPQTYLERAYYLVKQVLIEQRSPNLFDLSESMYISYATLKSVIAKMNTTFQSFGVKFVCKQDTLLIIGDESSLRRLVSHVIFEESNSRFLDMRTLEHNFAPDMVRQIRDIVRHTFSGYDYYLNDYALMNLVLHFIIMVDRVKAGQSLVQKPVPMTDPKEQSLAQDLAGLLENAFGITLPETEKSQIYLLIKTNVNYGTAESIEDLKHIVEADILTAAEKAIAATADIYAVDMRNDRFLPPFALHLKGLLLRLSQKTYNKNPMLESIKRDCRIIYDIAIYIALQLEMIWRAKICEDEIAFIALHVGAELERQKTSGHKVRCALLCPGYRGIEERIYNQLLLDFGDEIHIVAAASQPAELDELEFDLLFTTVEMPSTLAYRSMFIAPFKLRERRGDIEELLSDARLDHKKQILRNNFSMFFDERLFYVNPPFADKDSAITAICRDMRCLGYVGDEFKGHVEQREAASSTAFGALAIPHSIHMDAIKTCIAVVLSKEGIRWREDARVHIVLLTAINKVERAYFADIYEALISYFDDAGSTERLMRMQSFEQLRDMLTQ